MLGQYSAWGQGASGQLGDRNPDRPVANEVEVDIIGAETTPSLQPAPKANRGPNPSGRGETEMTLFCSQVIASLELLDCPKYSDLLHAINRTLDRSGFSEKETLIFASVYPSVGTIMDTYYNERVRGYVVQKIENQHPMICSINVTIYHNYACPHKHGNNSVLLWTMHPSFAPTNLGSWLVILSYFLFRRKNWVAGKFSCGQDLSKAVNTVLPSGYILKGLQQSLCWLALVASVVHNFMRAWSTIFVS